METKICYTCKIEKPVDEFYRQTQANDGLQSSCKVCKDKYNLDWKHRNHINAPMDENTKCGDYLGCYITEQLLSKVFSNVVMMPKNYPGFDFTCSKGYKIDSKASIIRTNYKTKPFWMFNIRKNKIPDYFCCVAFDNRENLNVLHWWLFPSEVVNKFTGITIMNNEKSLSKWKMYERDPYKVVTCCNKSKVA